MGVHASSARIVKLGGFCLPADYTNKKAPQGGYFIGGGGEIRKNKTQLSINELTTLQQSLGRTWGTKYALECPDEMLLLTMDWAGLMAWS